MATAFVRYISQDYEGLSLCSISDILKQTNLAVFRKGMTREQLGICAEANLHSHYLLYNVLELQEAAVRHKLARIPQLLQRLAEHFSEAMLSGIVAISSHYWDCLYPDQRPEGLHPFPALDSEHITVELSMADLLIQIRSDRMDVNYLAIQQIQQLLYGHIELLHLLQGFRFLDGRQLTGFIDAPMNPRGVKRRQSALISANQSLHFASGSYLYFFRCRLDIKRWQQLSITEQEEIMGYTKSVAKPLVVAAASTTELSPSVQPLLQQNMVFAEPSGQGTLHQWFSADAEQLLDAWQRRLGLDVAEEYDRLLDYCQLDLAMTFFVPAISWLEANA